MSHSRRLFIVLSVLVPVCLAGWLVWLSARGGDREQSPGTLPSTSSDPDTSRPEMSGKTQELDGSDGEGRPLRGKVIVIDPGHHRDNRNHTREIARPVDIGTGHKECDATGAATNSGYTEANFTLDVARRARTLLERRGATVTLTQDDDRPYGPCIDERARIGNRKKADAVVSVHADGAGIGDRGFHVIVPAIVRGGIADTSRIAGPSRRLGERLADAFAAATGMPPADYLGNKTAATGLNVRDDLGGLNLSRVPKVFLECGNMRDSQDARRLTDPKWRGRAAQGISDGIEDFLGGTR